MRPPDYVIGGPHVRPLLLRWHLIPYNKHFAVYLHKILRDDDCPELHRHPWWNVSILLRGAYQEFRDDQLPRVHRAGSVIFRRAASRHRLEVVKGPVWTVFITGPQQKS